jgi:16S rRNA (cytosine1402-N4)-methyltransferase
MRASIDASLGGQHTPVLYQRVLQALQPSAGERYIDGTIGAGGHSFGILEASSPDGQVLGLDLDPSALRIARKRLSRFGDRFQLQHGSFAEMTHHVTKIQWHTVAGILLDLGISSMQLGDPSRGFSFREEGPLDMRFNPQQTRTASELVNNLGEQDLATILAEFGEEPRARQVAKAIVNARPVHSTGELAEIVSRVVKRGKRRIHPATRVFQALRIAVNNELESLSVGLEQAINLLQPSGRLIVISFHSLEDRIVKRFFRTESVDCICPPDQPVCTCDHRKSLKILSRRPIRPDAMEVEKNPRARSARMRVAEKLDMA